MKQNLYTPPIEEVKDSNPDQQKVVRTSSDSEGEEEKIAHSRKGINEDTTTDILDTEEYKKVTAQIGPI